MAKCISKKKKFSVDDLWSFLCIVVGKGIGSGGWLLYFNIIEEDI